MGFRFTSVFASRNFSHSGRATAPEHSSGVRLHTRTRTIVSEIRRKIRNTTDYEERNGASLECGLKKRSALCRFCFGFAVALRRYSRSRHFQFAFLICSFSTDTVSRILFLSPTCLCRRKASVSNKNTALLLPRIRSRLECFASSRVRTSGGTPFSVSLLCAKHPD